MKKTCSTIAFLIISLFIFNNNLYAETKEELIERQNALMKKIVVYAVHEDKINMLPVMGMPSEVIKAVKELKNSKKYNAIVKVNNAYITLKKEYGHIVITGDVFLCKKKEEKSWGICKILSDKDFDSSYQYGKFIDPIQYLIGNANMLRKKGIMYLDKKVDKDGHIANFIPPQVWRCEGMNLPNCDKYSMFRFFPDGSRRIEIDDLVRMAGENRVLTRQNITKWHEKTREEIDKVVKKSKQKSGKVVPEITFELLPPCPKGCK